MVSGIRYARIAGTGRYIPERIVTNEELEEMVEGFEEEKAGKPFSQWVEGVTGIKARPFANEKETAEYMGTEALRRALDDARVKASDLDRIIFATFTQSRDIPNPPCTAGGMLGAGNVGAIHVNAGCTGYITGLGLAYEAIKAGCKRVGVIAAEKMHPILDKRKPKVYILFGDAASAAVIEESDEPGLFAPYFGSTYSENDIIKENDNLKNPFEKTYLLMPDGKLVFKNAVKAMAEAAREASKKTHWEKVEDSDLIIPHQGNGRMNVPLAERLHVPVIRVCDAIEHTGNTSGASCGVVYDMCREGLLLYYKLENKGRVILTAVAGGYLKAGIGAIFSRKI